MEGVTETGTRAIELVRRREEALARLREEPKQKPQLVEELDVSRSTVDRAISELTRVGLVCRVPGGYRTTTLGASLLEAYRGFRRTATTATGVEPLRETPATLTPPPAALAAMEQVESLDCDGSDRLRLLGGLDPARGMPSADGAVTLVVDRPTLATVRDHSPARLQQLAETDGCRVLLGEVPDDSLCLVGRGERRQVVVTLRGADGDRVATLASDRDPATRWGERTFDAHTDRATDVTDALCDPDRRFEDACPA